MNVNPLDPTILFESLMSATSNSTKRRNLELIQAVCKERAAIGARDFSLRSIGAAVEQLGGFKTKTLWNSQSADYQSLISSWCAFSGIAAPEKGHGNGCNDPLLRNIPDPATRIVVEKLRNERDALRSEVNILKSQTSLVIDRRPISTTLSPKSTSSEVEVVATFVISPAEREALEHSVSQQLMEAEGWAEEQNGRVVKKVSGDRTRPLLKPGFTTGIRKVLAATSIGVRAQTLTVN